MRETIKICFADNLSSVAKMESMLSPFGKYEISSNVEPDTDFVICWGISKMEHALAQKNMCSHAKLITYNWDVYGWVWDSPRDGEYDYLKYGELLGKSIEVWNPSERTKLRMEQWGREKWGKSMEHGEVIKSYIPYYDVPTKDGRYALNALRSLPDKNDGLFEKACTELEIPFKSPQHGMSEAEFQKTVAECTFICVPFYENSTGGLSLLEAYYLGKPALISDSPWQSAIEYVREATYFKWDDYEDFKLKLKKMWEDTPKVPKDHKQWVIDNYSERVMGEAIHKRLQKLYNK